MTQQLAVLSIRKCTGGYSFTLQRSDEPFRGTTRRQWSVSVEPDIIAVARRMLEDGVRIANLRATATAGVTDAAEDNFVSAGHGLFNALFPQQDPHLNELRKELQELQTPLLIETEEPNLLWEMLHDGGKDGFLGLEYDVGRRLLIRGRSPQGVPREGPWRCLLIADPNSDEPSWALPQAAVEAEKLRASLERREIVCRESLYGRQATFDAVTSNLLLREYDIIHYAGHVVFDDAKNEYALRLAGAKLLHASTLRPLVRGNPIVFLNACWSAQVSELAGSVESVQGLTDAFLQAGAKAVVGSLFRVPDAGGRVFAETFYERLLGGRTLGEAMRGARTAVFGKPQYGAAWACFVMYGDPCLRVELSIDELAQALQHPEDAERLGREDFAEDGLHIVEKAFEYARRHRRMRTVHLFAALAHNPDGAVCRWLVRRGVPGEALHAASQRLFREGGETPENHRSARHDQGELPPMTLTSNARAVLLGARKLAGGPIGEPHLVAAFARGASGRTREALRAMQLDVRELDPADHTPPPRPSEGRGRSLTPDPVEPRSSVERAGSLSRGACTSDGWAVIDAAVAGALRRRVGGIDSASFAEGLAHDPAGPLRVALGRLGASVDSPGDRKSSNRSPPLPVEVPVSASVKNAFVHAQAHASEHNRLVSGLDLLVGFVETGGGKIGQALRRKGFVLEALTTRLMLDTGGLDLACFDDSGRALIEATTAVATIRGHAVVGRQHLLHALLSENGGELDVKLREQGMNTEMLADLWLTQISTGGDPRPATSWSNNLLRVLIAADTRARTFRRTLVSSADLLAAYLNDGQNEGAEFLVRNGMRLKPLL
jgi:hypothetical protein